MIAQLLHRKPAFDLTRNFAPVMPHVNSGRIRLLAVTSAKRFASLANTPTIVESGMPDFVT